jgi:hypothetical protein
MIKRVIEIFIDLLPEYDFKLHIAVSHFKKFFSMVDSEVMPKSLKVSGLF